MQPSLSMKYIANDLIDELNRRAGHTMSRKPSIVLASWPLYHYMSQNSLLGWNFVPYYRTVTRTGVMIIPWAFLNPMVEYHII